MLKCGGGGEKMNKVIDYFLNLLCELGETSLHNTSIRGNYQMDLRELKK